MSIAGISSTSWLNPTSQTIQNNFQQFRKEFQQLGQDLQTGNVSAAQQDFATLQQLTPQSSAASPLQSNSPISQDFNQLAQDLKSGNMSAAQQDYTKIQQDFQSRAVQAHHHHHHGGGSSEITQLLNQLGQDLQSGTLSDAQQVYATLQQDLQQFGLISGQNSAPSSSPSNSNTVSVIA